MILETTIRRLEPPKTPARHLVALPRPEREGNGRSGAVRMMAESGLALALLLLASPLILLLAVLVRLTSPGPSFYRQVRRGLTGRPFWIIKLRTMTHQCEAGTGARWSTPGDPRVTRFGRFLRDSHFDELPQLWNVVRGEMALIGPRPERPELTPHLERDIPHYLERERVRPGMTGLSQVTLPADVEIADVQAKVECDLRYIRDRSLRLDLVILAMTALKVVLGLLRASRSVVRAIAHWPDSPPGAPHARLG
jgi:lipopolysaccharide/colanic/teichoic acid biosynthesis glycosyltransferase